MTANRKSYHEGLTSDGVTLTPLTDARDEVGNRVSFLFNEDWELLAASNRLDLSASTGTIPKRFLSTTSILDVGVEGGTLRKRRRTSWTGVGLTVLSSIFFACSLWLVQNLSQRYDLVAVTLWRFQGVLVPSLVPMAVHAVCYRRRDKFRVSGGYQNPFAVGLEASTLVFVRAFLSCNAVLLYFVALQYLDISDAAVIASATPFLTYLLAYFWLGEPCGLVPAACSVCIMAGVAFITRPPHLTGAQVDHDTMIGVALAFSSALVASVGLVILRSLKKVHYSYTMFSLGAVGTLELGALAYVGAVAVLPENMRDWLYSGALAVLCFLGQFTLITALKFESTGLVSAAKTFDLLFGFMVQMVLSRSIPDGFSFVGAGFVLIGLLVLMLRKYIESLTDSHHHRRTFSVLLS